MTALSESTPKFLPDTHEDAVYRLQRACELVMTGFTAKHHKAASTTGLVEQPPRLRDGLLANTYVQPRVDHFDASGNPVEANIIKITTMVPQTDAGSHLEELLVRAEVSTKDRNEYRVFRPLLRKTSFDELPQLFVNVMGVGSDKFDNPMQLSLFGSARPVLAEEVCITGDNANDSFGRALDEFSSTMGVDRTVAYNWFTKHYKPGLITPALATGHRQLNNDDDWLHYLKGINHASAVSELAAYKQQMLKLAMLTRTAVHIVAGRNAN